MPENETTGTAERWPGADLGLAESGHGSLASWKSRVTALILDWAASMAVAVGLFGTGVLNERGWKSFMILTVFFVESALLTTLAAGSFGQLIARIAVVRLDRRPLGILRAFVRAALVCLALPPLVVGPHRRGLHDLTAGTVVVNRR